MIIGWIISAIVGAAICYVIMESMHQSRSDQKRLRHQKEEFCQCYEKIMLSECPEDVLQDFTSPEQFEDKLEEIKKSVKTYNL